MKLTLEEGLIYDDKEEIVAEVDEKSKSVLFDVPITKELAAAVEKLTGEGYDHVEPISAAPKPKAKKKAAKKAAEPEKPTYPHPNPQLKDPEYVEWLHDNDQDEFRKKYGVREEVKLGDKRDHRRASEKEDNRYPARRTTVLTKKAHP